MSVLGVLKNIGKVAGIVAAPFTGGASLALTALGGLGDVAGAASQGRASGREAEAQYLLDRDKLAMDRASQERGDQFKTADLDLARRQQGDQLDASTLKRALQLGLLGSNPSIKVPDFLQGHMGTVEGVGPQAVQGRDDIIAAMRPRVMDALEKGQQYSPLTLADLPGLSTPSQPGKLDKFLNIFGSVGSVAGAMAPAYGAKPKIPTGANPTQLLGPGGSLGGVRF